MEQEKQCNMLTGFHIKKHDENGLVLNTNKLYKWFIPKNLRDSNIQNGDIVIVKSFGKKHSEVLVMSIYHQKFKKHEKTHKPIFSIKERAPRPGEK